MNKELESLKTISKIEIYQPTQLGGITYIGTVEEVCSFECVNIDLALEVLEFIVENKVDLCSLTGCDNAEQYNNNMKESYCGTAFEYKELTEIDFNKLKKFLEERKQYV